MCYGNKLLKKYMFLMLASLPGVLWGQVQRDEGQRLVDEQRAKARDEALSRPQPLVAVPEGVPRSDCFNFTITL